MCAAVASEEDEDEVEHLTITTPRGTGGGYGVGITDIENLMGQAPPLSHTPLPPLPPPTQPLSHPPLPVSQPAPLMGQPYVPMPCGGLTGMSAMASGPR